MRRSIGYCEDICCHSYAKGVFLLDHIGTFYCPECRKIGWVEPEKIKDHNSAPDPNWAVYKLVKVHFNFNPANHRYTDMAIVEINELKFGEEYEIWSPLIKTEKRAFKVAESTLCLLNSGIRAGDERLTNEYVMDFGKENWDLQIENLSRVLEERERRVAHAFGREQ